MHSISTKTYTSESHGIAKRETLALSIYFAFFYGAIAFNVTYFPIFLRDRGLSLSQMAVLLAVSAAAGGLLQTRVGHWTDSVGSRKAMAAGATALLGVSYLFYNHAHSFWQFLPLYAWSGACCLIGLTLPQAIISDWTGGDGSTAHGFSVTRTWGSIGFLVVMLLLTAWPDLMGGVAFLYWAAGFYIAAAIPLLLMREGAIITTDHAMLKGTWTVIRSQRVWVFLICFILFRLTETGMLNYLGLYIKELGGGMRQIATAFWIAAVAEIPLVLYIGKMSDRIGRRVPMIVAFVVWPLRLFAYSLMYDPVSIYYAQLFHGFTYGILMVCSVAYMSDIAPRDLRGTAQGVLNTAGAVAMASGPLLTGFLGDTVGLRAAFQVMAGAVALGLVLLVTFVREPIPHNEG